MPSLAICRSEYRDTLSLLESLGSAFSFSDLFSRFQLRQDNLAPVIDRLFRYPPADRPKSTTILLVNFVKFRPASSNVNRLVFDGDLEFKRLRYFGNAKL